jgi:methionyl-tRNA formyltransferase
MKIAFFGASSLGFTCCQALLDAGHEIVAIFTIPKEFNISYSPGKPVNNVLHKDFNVLGKQFDIPVFEVNQNIKDYIETIEILKPDFILAIGWYYMIPKNILCIANKGAAGIHASLLPKGRGNAPLVWSLINGEPKSGITFFYFADGVDNGDIIGQREILIDENETIKTLLDKVEIESKSLLLEFIPLIAENKVEAYAQDNNEATYYPKRSPEDGLIDWKKSSKDIDRFIRAQTKPYPGAFTIIENKKVIIWDATIIDLKDESL